MTYAAIVILPLALFLQNSSKKVRRKPIINENIGILKNPKFKYKSAQNIVGAEPSPCISFGVFDCHKYCVNEKVSKLKMPPGFGKDVPFTKL